MSYCLLIYRNSFLSVLIICLDVLIKHSSNDFYHNLQQKKVVITSACGIWDRSQRMERMDG